VGGGGSGVAGARGRLAPTPSGSRAPPPASASSGRIAVGSPPPVPRRPRVGCGSTACIAMRASHSLFPTIPVVFHPGPPRPGRGASTCPLPSPKGSRGGGNVVGARPRSGGDAGRTWVRLQVAARGHPRGPPPTPLPWAWPPTYEKPRGVPPFWTGTGAGGRGQKSDGSDGERLFLRGSCRGVISRVRSHTWPGTFPWQWDSSEEAGLFMTTRAPGHLGRGPAWPHGHLLPRWAPQHHAQDGSVKAILGCPTAPRRLHPSCHPGLATFHGSPLSLGHARLRVLWSARAYVGLNVH